jgi:hypothetical protein
MHCSHLCSCGQALRACRAWTYACDPQLSPGVVRQGSGFASGYLMEIWSVEVTGVTWFQFMPA